MFRRAPCHERIWIEVLGEGFRGLVEVLHKLPFVEVENRGDGVCCVLI